MSALEQPDEKANTYFVDPESAAEMARLIKQDIQMNEALGGFFPEQPDLAAVSRLLDIACGPGGWGMSVAQQYPHIQVTGIDISALMIAYATAQAQRLAISGAHFEIMNALEPWTFPDAYFNLVNSRLSSGFIPRKSWPTFLQECLRVTLPGGILRVIEIDRLGITNSPAFEKFQNLFTQFYFQKGLGFSPDGLTFGMTPMLPELLADAGYEDVKIQPFAVDFSYGTVAHESLQHNTAIAFKQLEPLFLKAGLATQVELHRLHEAVLQEFGQETFRAVAYQLLVWGKKPL